MGRALLQSLIYHALLILLLAECDVADRDDPLAFRAQVDRAASEYICLALCRVFFEQLDCALPSVNCHFLLISYLGFIMPRVDLLSQSILDIAELVIVSSIPINYVSSLGSFNGIKAAHQAFIRFGMVGEAPSGAFRVPESPRIGDKKVLPELETQPSQTYVPAARLLQAHDWQGSDDPEDPLNRPLWKKVYRTTMAGLLCLTMWALLFCVHS